MEGEKKFKPVSEKRKSRLLALEALFQYEFRPDDVEEIGNFDWNEQEYDNYIMKYAKILYYGTVRNIEQIDQIIKKYTKKWDFDRINKIDKTILRFSIYQLLFDKNLNKNIIIDEAVEIAKSYSGVSSYKFVNGVLDAIAKDLKKEFKK